MSTESFLKTPLAIVGMACRLPGADNLDEYWNLVRDGRSGISELPESRLNRELYYTTEKGVRGKSYTKVAGLIPERPLRRELLALSDDQISQSDDCHLNMCEVAATACLHAGYDPRNLPLRNVGVYVGHSGGSPRPGEMSYATLAEELADYLRQAPAFEQVPAELREPLLASLVEKTRQGRPKRMPSGLDQGASGGASLISKSLGLTGPQMVLDAACSSSLMALALGAQALQLGQIDMALIGGASYAKAESVILFSQAQSCSASGSRPFDADADGMVGSEGYVAVLIKTLARALADGDQIHGVIRGIGLSSDGRGRSLWAPRKEGQVAAVRRAYGPGVEPQDVQYVEAHATSTQVGDATEVEALIEVFSACLPKGAKLPMGSVKANIGHTLETAGLASLVKVALAMRAARIPPAINVRKLNESIDWPNAPFYVAQQEQAWNKPASGAPRRAAINSFGIGGLNAHVVLDEYEPAVAKQWAAAVKPAQNGRVVAMPGVVPADDAVAIIGCGAVLPGARTIDAFWDLLAAGRSAICEAPRDRLRADLSYTKGTRENYRTGGILGGFVRDYVYDWKKHKIPPRQIATANPLQFMLLDAADQALAQAGYDRKAYDRIRTGVVVGAAFGGDFSDQLQLGLRLPEFEKHLHDQLAARGVPAAVREALREQFHELVLKERPALTDETGSFTASTLASRISKTLDLMGCAVALDAGDSSSVAAVNVGVNMLLAGACDMILCAGAYRGLGLVSQEIASVRGHQTAESPKPGFDAQARGFVLGEGAGLVLLKRLADAQRDGDPIRAVIRGIGAGGDPKNLEQSLRLAATRAIAAAGVSPADVAYVAATGTGFPAFDAAEAGALRDVYGPARQQPLLVGSSSAQIGYLQSAQGMASLLKATLGMEHGTVPPSAGHTAPGAAVQAAGASLAIVPAATPLRPATQPGHFLTAVDDVSHQGATYHVILERGVPAPVKAAPAAPVAAVKSANVDVVRPAVPSRIVRFGAASEAALGRLLSEAQSEQAFAQADKNEPFAAADRYRVAIVAENAASLGKKLELARKQFNRLESRAVLEEQGIYCRQAVSKARVAFLFSGQGSQYQGMLRELIAESPAAAAAARDADAVLARLGAGSFADIAWLAGDALGRDPWLTQASILLADVVAYAALVDAGLRPDVITAHSFGEFPALVAAGSWSLEQALRITRLRCEVVERCPRGVLASTSASPEVIARLSAGLAGVSVTNCNAPDQTVVGGNEAAVTALGQRLAAEGFLFKPLPVPRPYHTPLLAAAQAPFAKGLESEVLLPPRTPVLSSVNNRYVAEPDDIRQNLTTQLVAPVPYVDQIERLADEGVSVFIEVGPQQVLSRLTRRILDRLPDVAIVSVDNPKRPGREQLQRIVALCECLGILGGAPRDAGRSRLPDGTSMTREGLPHRPAPVRQTGPAKALQPIEQFDATARRRERLKASGGGAVAKPKGTNGSHPAPKAAPVPVAEFDATGARRQKLRTAATTGTLARREETVATPVAKVAAPKPPAPVLPAPVLAPVASATAVARAAVAAPAPAKAPQGDLAGLEQFLINFVVEQTGYPAEIVELDADLEADLGIDSIKKAQLFGELREFFEINADAWGGLSLDDFRTLRHIVAFLGDKPRTAAGQGIAPAVVKAEAAPAAKPAVAAVAPTASPVAEVAKPAGSLEQFLIDFVVEQTGYPTEIVELDADLEADLGIDSIKKAQLFGELREYFEITADSAGGISLDDFPTLRHIVEFLRDKPGKGEWLNRQGAAPTAPAPASATPVAKVAPPAPAPIAPTPVAPAVEADLGGLEQFLINFVVEQTGYPAEIVELDADLEADLGIDSIKKAQLFGELREYFEITAATSGNLSLDDFPTLRHILSFLADKSRKGALAAASPAPVVAAPAPVAAPTRLAPVAQSPAVQTPVAPAPVAAPNGSPSEQELSAFLVNFVVEQTGYPAEIVELDADLEADLGIDSIKKAQLFGELREYFDITAAAQGSLSLDDFPTLRHIQKFLAGVPAKGGFGHGGAGAPAAPRPTAPPAAPTVTPVQPATVTATASAPTPATKAASSTTAAASHAELASFLINFVVEQTGYPAEIVELDANLEADLGIDSIKKAQLFGELREFFDISAAMSGNLSLDDFPSLRHILNFLADKPRKGAAAAQTSSAPQNSSAPQTSAVRATAPAVPTPPPPVLPAPIAPAKAAASTVLELRGTPYEMGLAHGQAYSAQIRTILKRVADLPREQLATTNAQLQPELLFSPADLEELRGLADGAGVHQGNIVAHNLSLYPDYVAGCAQFAVTSRRNGGAGLLHAMNEDSPLALSVPQCLTRVVQLRRPERGLAFVTSSIVGQACGLSGVNAAGVAVSSTLLLDHPRRGSAVYGSLHSSLVKQILEEAHDLDQALAIVRRSRRLGAWSLCLSHAATDRVCYLEYDGDWLEIGPERDLAVSTNHSLLRPSTQAPEHSQHRLTQLEKLLAAGGVTADSAQRVLRDRHDGSRGRETAHPTMNTIRRVDNQVSVVMRPGAAEMWVTAGPASLTAQDEFQRIDLGALGPAPKPAAPQPVSPKTEPVRAEAPARELATVKPADIAPLTGRPAPVTRDGTPATTQRFILRMIPNPLPADAPTTPILHGPAVILGANDVARALQARLVGMGVQATILDQLDDADQAVAQFEEIWKRGAVKHLFLTTPRDPDAAVWTTAADWTRRRQRGVRTPYRVLQRWFGLAAEGKTFENTSLVAITSVGGDFGLGGHRGACESGFVAGLLKALNVETMFLGCQNVPIKIVDAPADAAPQAVVDLALRELAAGASDLEVADIAGVRHTIRAIERPIVEPLAPLPKDGVWVVTGGARGVTAYVARGLGELGQRLHLVGTTALPQLDPSWRNLDAEGLKKLRSQVMVDSRQTGKNGMEAWRTVEKALEIDRTLQEFAAAGIRCTYHACDVVDRAALGRVLDEVRRIDGPIHGVIHGAGFAQDQRFDRKTPKIYESCISAKVDGAANLIELTRQDPIRYFAVFGSISGRFGANGQTDYSSSNDMLAKQMDRFRLERPEVHAVAFQWHAWGGAGMAMRPENKLGLEMVKIAFMPPVEGVGHLLNEFRSQERESEVLITDQMYFRHFFPHGDVVKTCLGGGHETRNFPLASRWEVTPEGRLATLELPLDPTTDPFLLEHLLQGRPILPVVIGSEALCEAARALDPRQKIIGLRNLRAQNGLRFHTDQPLSAKATAVRAANGIECSLTCDFRTRDGRLVEADRKYLTATLDVAPAPRRIDMPRPQAPAGDWQPIQYVGRDAAVFHGPPLRCLQAIQVLPEGAWGKVRVPDLAELAGPNHPTQDWNLPSAVLDACLYASAVCAWFSVEPAPNLPLSLGHLRLGVLPQAGEECLLRVKLLGREGRQVKFEFTLWSPSGEVVLDARDYRVTYLGA